MQITVYSTVSSNYSLFLKKFLKEKGFSFTEKYIDQSDLAQKEMKSLTGGFLGVPCIAISKDNGQKETVVGFDQEKISSILGVK